MSITITPTYIRMLFDDRKGCELYYRDHKEDYLGKTTTSDGGIYFKNIFTQENPTTIMKEIKIFDYYFIPHKITLDFSI